MSDSRLADAACYEKWEEVKRLLKEPGIDLNGGDSVGRTALYWTCWSGNVEIVELLLGQKGIEVNKAENGGYTPFHIACNSGKSEVVKILMNDNRVDLNKADKSGWTPFHWACFYNKIEVVKLLISNEKVDLLAKTTLDDFYGTVTIKSGSTAIDIARQRNHNEIVKLIENVQEERRREEERKRAEEEKKKREEEERRRREEKRKREEEERKRIEEERKKGQFYPMLISIETVNKQQLMKELKTLIQEHKWEQIKSYCETNIHLSIQNDFFNDLPLNLSFYSSQVIFNRLSQIKDQLNSKKDKLNDSLDEENNTMERYQATLIRHQKIKKDLEEQIERIKLEIKQRDKEILEEQEKIKNHEEKTKQDRQELVNLTSILKKIDESEIENKKRTSEINKKLEEWKNSNNQKQISNLNQDEILSLMSMMNIEYDTKSNMTGEELVELGPKPLQTRAKVDSLGDRKRLLDAIKKGSLSMIQVCQIPVVSKNQQEETKVKEWNYEDVNRWISNIEGIEEKELKEIEKSFKKHKIDGNQLLLLKDEEIENEMGMKKEMIKKICQLIDKLKEKNKIDLNEIVAIPEDLKCLLSKKLMEDPVMASDGETYDRKYIEEYMKNNKQSPVTKEEFEHNSLTVNRQAKRKIDEFKKSHGL